MSTSALVQAYEPQARQIAGLPATITYLPDNPEVVTGLRAFLTGAVGFIEGAPNYTVTPRIALHELGHLWHFNNRTRQDAFWTARFGSCTTAPKTWDEAYHDAHPVSGTEIWMVLPGETIAECFAVAVEGVGAERTLNYGCAIDPAAMRAFFGGIPATLPPPQKEPVIEWIGPVPSPNFTLGRDGNPVSLIVDHWMAATWTSADARFKNPASQVSAHFGVTQTGAIKQWVSTDDTAYHAGNYDVNLRSVGIEHECGPLMPPTAALYAASAWLHNKLAETFHLTLEVGVTVKPHRAIVPTTCPGTLDLNHIVEEANDMAFTDADRAMLARIKDILEAREPLVWQARAQRFLDVERGVVFNPNLPPIDSRIKAP